MTTTVHTLVEDLQALGMEALDNHLLGLSEDAQSKEEADADEGDSFEEDGFDPGVVEAANAIYLHVRPQIDEDLIDYDVDKFESDLITAIANLVEAQAEALEESERDFDQIAVSVSEVVAEAYNDLTLDDGSLEESEQLDERARAKRRAGPRGKKIQGVGRNVRVGAKGRQVKVRGAEDVMKSRIGAAKRTAGVLAKKRRQMRIKRKTGAYKATARKAKMRQSMYASDTAAELAGLMDIAESVEESVVQQDPIRAGLAEAFDRVSNVAAMLGDFFEFNGIEEDVEIAAVMDDVMESCGTAIDSVETLSEDEFDIKAQLTKLQAFAKVIARAEEEYAKYDLVDGEGNIVEFVEDDEDDEEGK